MAGISSNVKLAVARLRRYAFCLYGSLAQGDAAVEECLRRVDLDRLQDGPDALLGLFRSFHADRAGKSVPQWLSNGRSLDEEALHGSLLRLPLPQRQALILSEVCDFSLAEVAQVLDLSEREVRARIADGYRVLREPKMSALIIEDEPLLAEDISVIVSGLGIRVVGTAHSEKEAVFKAAETRPGLILADVRLSQGSGLSAVNTIRRFHAPRVAFLTAFPSEVLSSQGERESLIVAKPFERDAVEAAVRKLAGMVAAA
ncbi:response regulator [Afifella pfennigii]|uniref:response regulator n=1 Tax=Afifella pfennigii TaxID=209897 RepID=UPI000552DC6A|nr:response regulator [Afifella pfennigii]